MKLGMWVVLSPGHIVLDGDPAPSPPKGHSPPQFVAHICCGPVAGWIKMPLGTEVNLGPGDVVLDVVAATPKKEAQPPVFGPCLLWSRSPISATVELLSNSLK